MGRLILMKDLPELERIILSTLSFYEPMSFSKIVFDIDTKTLESYPNFDQKEMFAILNSLEKQGLVKKSGEGSDVHWVRIHKKKSLWRRFRTKIGI